MNYGIKVSKPGKNVLTETDKDLSFTTNEISFKIHKTSLNGAAPAVTVNLHDQFDPPNTATVNIAHGLSYQPSFLIWCQDEDKNWHFQNSLSFGLKAGTFPDISTNVHAVYCATDLTNLIINIINLSTSTNYTVAYHYIIFNDRATL